MEVQTGNPTEEVEELETEEVEAMEAVVELVIDEPDAVDAIIRSYNVVPEQDEAKKALQLVLLSQRETRTFDEVLGTHLQHRDFKGFKGFFKKIGGIFKKKEGGRKVGNFFRNIFKGRKKVLADAVNKIAAGIPLTKREQRLYDKAYGQTPAPKRLPTKETEYPPGISLDDQLAIDAEAEAAAKEKEKKKKQNQQFLGIGAGVLGLIIVIVVIVLIARAQRRRRKSS